jgi:hypothetical protein
VSPHTHFTLIPRTQHFKNLFRPNHQYAPAVKEDKVRQAASSVVAVKPRREIDDDHHRDDLKQVIAVILASVQRERATADQFYVRARNLLAYATVLFTAIQAAFLANLGRLSGTTPIIDGAERNDVATAAGISLGFLLIALIVLVGFADRARGVDVVTGAAALESYEDSEHNHQDAAVLEVLAVALATEDSAWGASNLTRKHLTTVLAWLTATSAAAALAELVLLYQALS